MKSSIKKEVWVLNLTKNDVMISDLGVKVPANQTVNICSANPYLTEYQINKSQKDGSLCNRLKSSTLKIIKKKTTNGKDHVTKVLSSDEPIKATRLRSAVVISHSTDEENTDSSGFDFADYGVDPISIPIKEDSSVLIKPQARDADVVDVIPASIIEPITEVTSESANPIVTVKPPDDTNNAAVEKETANAVDDRDDSIRIVRRTQDGIAILQEKE